VSDTYDQEKPRIAESARNAPAIKEQARQAKEQAGGGSYDAGTPRHGASAPRY
jgi:hypothetical protein